MIICVSNYGKNSHHAAEVRRTAVGIVEEAKAEAEVEVEVEGEAEAEAVASKQ